MKSWLVVAAVLTTIEVVPAAADVLTQFDSTGTHVLGTGVQSADIAFGPLGEVLEVVSSSGALTQFDAAGAHVLGTGVQSADIAFGPLGEVLVTVSADTQVVPEPASIVLLGGGLAGLGLVRCRKKA